MEGSRIIKSNLEGTATFQIMLITFPKTQSSQTLLSDYSHTCGGTKKKKISTTVCLQMTETKCLPDKFQSCPARFSANVFYSLSFHLYCLEYSFTIGPSPQFTSCSNLPSQKLPLLQDSASLSSFILQVFIEHWQHPKHSTTKLLEKVSINCSFLPISPVLSTLPTC